MVEDLLKYVDGKGQYVLWRDLHDVSDQTCDIGSGTQNPKPSHVVFDRR
jgi:hypothetical protein